MKLSSVLSLSALLIGGAAAAASANDVLSSLPSCALDCMKSSVAKSSCSATDISCLCGDETYSAAMKVCMTASCSPKEVLTSTNGTMVACGTEPKTMTNTLLGVSISFGITSLIIVTIRIIGKVFIVGSGLFWDDWLIIISMGLLGVTSGCCAASGFHGMGRDVWSIPFVDLYEALRMMYIAESFYMTGEMFAQLSILSFYMRIFPGSVTGLRKACYILGALVVGFGVSNTACMIFQCTPVPFFWKGWAGEMEGTCFNISIYSWIRAAVEIVLDVAILSLPLRDLWKLQMSSKKKTQVIGLFALGFLITVVSILRLQSILKFSKTDNPTYDNTPILYWSLLENNMLVICASLPAARSAIMHLVYGEGGGSSAPSYGHSSAAAHNMYFRHQGDSKDQGSHQLRSLGQSDAGSKSQPGMTESDEELVNREPSKWSAN